jgi:hypothetical protein
MPDTTAAAGDKTQTDVTKWLEENGAAEYVDAFRDEGYRDVADVDAAAIDELVKQKGTAARLKRSLAALAPAPDRDPLAPPTLPAGTTLDLSRPQLQSPDGITFQIPSELGVKATDAAIVSPASLTTDDWMVIARNSNLIYGWRMDGDAPTRPRRPVLDWVVPADLDFARPEMESEVDSALSYTEETASFVRAGFDSETATASYAFCSASVERSHKERHAQASSSKVLYATGSWRYPRARVFLDECTTASSRFVDAIRQALAAADPAPALQEVFVDFGHAVPREVLLGGQLTFVHTRRETGEVQEDQVEDEVKAAVAIKVGAAAGSGGADVGTGTSTSKASYEIADQMSFRADGGDTSLASSPSDWAPTVKDPRNWDAIASAGVKSTVDLLPADLRQRVLEFWSAVGVVPAISDPADRDPQIVRATSSGFLIGARSCGNGERGSVYLVSGRAMRDPDGAISAGAGAYAHAWHDGDTWYDTMSACLPVRKGDYCGTWFEDSDGAPRRLLRFAECDFELGPWQTFDVGQDVVAAGDGFLAVSVDAQRDGERGGASVTVDGVTMAGASAHRYTDSDNWIFQQSFCIPVPKGSRVHVYPRPTCGNPVVTARFMPLVDEQWQMLQAVQRTPGSSEKADTDGLLTAFIGASEGARGYVETYAGRGGSAQNDWSQPDASASVHLYGDSDRWVDWSTATLPVGRGSDFLAKLTNTCDAVSLQLMWTPIVPVN